MNPKRFSYILITLVISFVGLTFLILVFSIRFAAAEPITLYVDKSGNCIDAEPCFASIQSAINDANDGDLIKISGGIYTATGLQIAYISKPLKIQGGYTVTNWHTSYPISQATVLDSIYSQRQRGLYIDSLNSGKVEINGITVRNGNVGLGQGGGIYIDSGNVDIFNSTILSNTSEGYSDPYGRGGGLYINSGTVVISNSLFRNNRTAVRGGAINIQTGDVLIEKSQFFSNFASEGSALYMNGGTAIIRKNSFINHDCNDGTIHIFDGTVSFISNLFTDNVCSSRAGAIHIESGYANIIGNQIISNSAEVGGGLSFLRGNVNFRGNEVYSNHSTEGGAIYIQSTEEADVIISGNIISNNYASATGGALHLFSGKAIINRNEMISNSAAIAGGAIYVLEGHLNSTNDVIANNRTPLEAIRVANSTFEATHLTLVDNGYYGLYSSNSTSYLTNTIVASHTIGGLTGQDIYSRYNLFFNNGEDCTNGAICENNYQGDPMFIDVHSQNYHIGQSSEAINKGILTAVLRDIDNEPRISQPDIGADEYWPHEGPFGVYIPFSGN